ncbi:putative global transcription activator SNF2L1, partial [Zancudomyces culisetae]
MDSKDLKRRDVDSEEETGSQSQQNEVKRQKVGARARAAAGTGTGVDQDIAKQTKMIRFLLDQAPVFKVFLKDYLKDGRFAAYTDSQSQDQSQNQGEGEGEGEVQGEQEEGVANGNGRSKRRRSHSEKQEDEELIKQLELEEGADGGVEGNGEEVGAAWIMPAKRERKVNYAVDDYYREAMRGGSGGGSGSGGGGGGAGGGGSDQPRGVALKQPTVHDFQFYPKDLYEILELEKSNWQKSRENEDKKTEFLTEQEQQVKTELIEKCLGQTTHQIVSNGGSLGFPNITRRDYFNVLRLIERFGNTELALYEKYYPQDMFTDHNKEDVLFYVHHFLANYTTSLPPQTVERISAAIAKGNQKVAATRAAQRSVQLFATAIGHTNNNNNNNNNNKNSGGGGEMGTIFHHFRTATRHNLNGELYTPEEDSFLLCTLNNVDLFLPNAYDDLLAAVRRFAGFRFNWFIRSRSRPELQRRCSSL